jgi:hypothetical protein
MADSKPNPPGPLQFQIVLRARTASDRNSKWVNVVITQVYDPVTMQDYDGMAIDVDVETITERLKRSLLGRWP